MIFEIRNKEQEDAAWKFIFEKYRDNISSAKLCENSCLSLRFMCVLNVEEHRLRKHQFLYSF